MLSTAAGSEMSHTHASNWGAALPAAVMVSCRVLSRRPKIATRQPLLANKRAVARPTPVPPPVTTAVFVIGIRSLDQLPPTALLCPTKRRHPWPLARARHPETTACRAVDYGSHR